MKSSDRIVFDGVAAACAYALATIPAGLGPLWGLLPAAAVFLGLDWFLRRHVPSVRSTPSGRVIDEGRTSLRRYQQLIVEFPSGPLRSRLETLNNSWKKLLANLENDPSRASQTEGFQYRYAESLVPILENALRQSQPLGSDLEALIDELIRAFEDTDQELSQTVLDRLEAGLELLTPPKT